MEELKQELEDLKKEIDRARKQLIELDNNKKKIMEKMIEIIFPNTWPPPPYSDDHQTLYLPSRIGMTPYLATEEKQFIAEPSNEAPYFMEVPKPNMPAPIIDKPSPKASSPTPKEEVEDKYFL